MIFRAFFLLQINNEFKIVFPHTCLSTLTFSSSAWFVVSSLVNFRFLKLLLRHVVQRFWIPREDFLPSSPSTYSLKTFEITIKPRARRFTTFPLFHLVHSSWKGLLHVFLIVAKEKRTIWGKKARVFLSALQRASKRSYWNIDFSRSRSNFKNPPEDIKEKMTLYHIS